MTPVPDAVWSSSQLARLARVSLRTARRWIEKKAMPAAVAALAGIVAGGDLGLIDERWKGWRLVRGCLYAPDLAHGFEPGEVMAIPYVRLQVFGYQRELKYYRQAETLSGPPCEPVNENERRALLSAPPQQQVA